MNFDKIDKLTDKVFMRLIITSVLAIVVCMVCLCSSTWAWFSESQESNTNLIKSSNCLLTVTVKDNNNNEVSSMNLEDGAKEITIPTGATYTVTLSVPTGSSSGYCVMTLIDGDGNAENDIVLHSQAVSNNGSPYHTELSFSIEADGGDKKISIKPSWGIYSSDPDVVAGNTVKLGSDDNGNKVSISSEETNSVATE